MRKMLVLPSFCVLALCMPSQAYWAGGAITGSRYGAIGAGVGAQTRVGSMSSVYPATRMTSLPSGMINLNGEIVDTTNKVLQRVTGVGGTQYYSYLNQKSGPIFQTSTVDTGKHFILFQDVNYPPGDGHYIVLKRWRGSPLGGTRTLGGAMYEAYYLDLGDSINALVSNWNMASYTPMGLTGLSYGAYGGGMGLYGRRTNVRMTRASQPEEFYDEEEEMQQLPEMEPVPKVKKNKRVRKKVSISEAPESEAETDPQPEPEPAEAEAEATTPETEEPATATQTTQNAEETTVTVVTESGAGDQIVSEETTEMLKMGKTSKKHE